MTTGAQDLSKRASAEKACELVKDKMKVGLGTGSTAEWAIKRLGERARDDGLDIVCVPSSKRTEELAKIVKLPLISYGEFLQRDLKLDIDIDGTDRVDPEFRLIKGGGGAQTREKAVANASKLFLCVADESKLVPKLIGSFPLPVEVIPDYYRDAASKLRAFGHPKLREKSGKVFITDNSNYILDIDLSLSVGEPERLEVDINRIPGVVDNGFFTRRRPDKVFVGYPDGRVKVLDRK